MPSTAAHLKHAALECRALGRFVSPVAGGFPRSPLAQSAGQSYRLSSKRTCLSLSATELGHTPAASHPPTDHPHVSNQPTGKGRHRHARDSKNSRRCSAQARGTTRKEEGKAHGSVCRLPRVCRVRRVCCLPFGTVSSQAVHDHWAWQLQPRARVGLDGKQCARGQMDDSTASPPFPLLLRLPLSPPARRLSLCLPSSALCPFASAVSRPQEPSRGGTRPPRAPSAALRPRPPSLPFPVRLSFPSLVSCACLLPRRVLHQKTNDAPLQTPARAHTRDAIAVLCGT
jgi:hypothetical protein